MVHLKVKKLTPEATLPKKGSEGAAGFDLVATSKEYVNKFAKDGVSAESYIEYGTGLALEIPAGYVGKIFPRSSVTKKGLHLANSVGIIDSDYRGEVKFRYKRTLDGVGEYEEGERIGQLILERLEDVQLDEVENLSDTERGSGGYGSTGA